VRILERLVKRLLVSLGTLLFVLALPLFSVLFSLPSLSNDERWYLKIAISILGPFSATLWYTVISQLVLHRRAGCLMQLVLFFGTAALIYLLLAHRVYSIGILTSALA
jgi:hypothetical protein